MFLCLDILITSNVRDKGYFMKKICEKCNELKQCKSYSIGLLKGKSSLSVINCNLCASCATLYKMCPNCKNLLLRGHFSGRFCKHCNYSNKIHKFDYNVMHKLKFFDSSKPTTEQKISKNKIYYGVELELSINRNFPLRSVVDESIDSIGRNFCITKHDGSIKPKGFEIVSAPATIDFHKKIWDVFFTYAKKRKCFVINSTCGMHVHVSRRALSNDDIELICYFIYNRDNYDIVKLIAGRQSNFFCDFKHNCGNDIKYTAINRLPSNTIEFRIFKATLDKLSFYKNIEFCDCLINFVKNKHKFQVNKSNFIKYIVENHTKYKMLHKFLENNHAI